VVLEADATGSSGAHTWSLKADPPVPGLGYAMSLVAYTPWVEEPGGGLSLQTALPANMTVGQVADVQLTAGMPSGLATALRLGLPAGVQADTPSLDALVSKGTVTRYETEDGAVTLHVPPQNAGSTFTATVRVVPTLAGSLSAAASTLTPEQRPQLAKAFAPKTWTVR